MFLVVAHNILAAKRLLALQAKQIIDERGLLWKSRARGVERGGRIP
jgi:hypothetical protein